MSTQITVQLPDDLVEELDALVAAGHASSRADDITRALRRDLRRRVAERDAEIMRASVPSADSDDLVAWTARHNPAFE